MTDFIRYVVTELKSKRLTKEHARTLLEQFAQGSGGARPTQLHPLLHTNTSDLSEQSYSSWFDGSEFFLADHQVRLGDASRKVLPAVAYLEMARAAIALALPVQTSQTLELRQSVWAQPVIVDGRRQVSIALLACDDGSVEYEIYSVDEEGQETVHCQGRGVYVTDGRTQPLALSELQARMTAGGLDPQALYKQLWAMGLEYGAAHRAVESVARGEGEALVRLQVPQSVESSSQAYALHPSLMDGALQACIGLLVPQDSASQTMLPYSVESVLVLRPCEQRMLAWVREASGSSAALRKLDLDLCDEQGLVCVQMRGFTARAVDGAALAPAQDLVLAVPQWRERPAPPQAGFTGKRRILLCGLDQVSPASLAEILAGSQCARLDGAAASEGLASHYTWQAVALFEQVQALLRGGLHGQELLQLVVADNGEHALSAGLCGLLRTAAVENPQLRAQLVLVDGTIGVQELAALLQAEPGSPSLVRYRDGRRSVQAWEQQRWQGGEWPVAFRDDGVYLITGGLGGLGQIFAQEIVRQTSTAQVVLTGRSVSDKTLPERTVYRQVDLEDLAAVQALIDDLTATFGRLDGILHSAGQVADEFILNKTSAIFAQVLGPKVAGTVNLDLATRGIALDFMVLFSSIASAMGNVGQADYASGNGFMDQFAAYRNALAAKGESLGRTVAINWPLWLEGGMKMEADSQAWMQQRFGVSPLQSAAGIHALYGALALNTEQAMVLQGEQTRLEQLLADMTPVEAAPQVPQAVAPAMEQRVGDLQEHTEDYLRRKLAGILAMPSSRIDTRAALETYGIDSVLAMSITRELEKTFGSLSKTLLFEYQTLAALAGYFIREHGAKVGSLFATASPAEPALPAEVVKPAAASARPARKKSGRRRAIETVAVRSDEPIAIIGMSGRFPQAWDLAAFWQNLREGRDCVTEVPAERWDWREYYSTDRTQEGRHYSKWGGFIEGVDQFDPLFFNISPREARNMDPQERLFLQQTWMALEDAGYTRAALAGGGQVGVYAGVMYSEYQLYGAQAAVLGQSLPLVGSLASVANRVSYVLNLHGPSMTLDTMCSSSLTAIHIACQDLKLGRTDMALAGGVNATVHPQKYHILSAGQFISSDGHCQSFGEGGDGYIPGEGVGVVVLKRLSDAQRDGDHICGVILGSSLNHGGKTNGYTVPNPQAQSSAIEQALAEAKVDARHISYVEAHGTGTKLGDPIEIAALGRAFGQYTQERGFCLIGSAKSNIGHCESAAGIAGLMKVLLQMRHGEIVPSLHSTKLNPHIDFEQTPFVVNQTLTAWERPVIDGREVGRIAGLSSFGAGGSNAHMIVQEYREQRQSGKAAGPSAIVLSARTPQQLRQKAADLLAYLEQGDCADLQSIAYTLQTGREAMDERLGILASDPSQLADRLRAFVGGDEEGEDLFRGQAKRSQDGMNLISQDEDMKEAVGKWIARRKYGKLLELWSKGLDIDWSQLHGQVRPQRVSLPAYPFAKERYWIEMGPALERGGQIAKLHPLLHTNTSDLSEQSYSSWFDGTEFFLADHQVKLGDSSRKVLPAVAYLEMARAAVSLALPAQPGQTLELRQSVWAQPVIVDGRRQVSIALQAGDHGSVEYEIYSVGDDGEETVHCDGSASYVVEGEPQPLALAALEAEMAGGVLDAETLYSKLWSMGLEYGPAHRAVQGVLRGDGQVLVRMQLPDDVQKSSQEYILHPSLMDGALQACASLLADGTAGTVLPYAVESVRVWQPCAQSMIAWVREASGSSAALRKLDLDLCDGQGSVCVQMRGFSARTVDGAALAPAQDVVLAVPQWRERPAPPQAGFTGKRRILLCGLDQVSPASLAEILAGSQCARLDGAAASEGLASRYTWQAVALFEQVQALLRGGLHGQELLQLVVADNGEHALSAGLCGLLRTAALENPQLRAQLVLVDGTIGVQELAALLQAEPGSPSLVRYRDGRRSVQAWEQQRWQGGEWPVAFRDDGVYLITGGLGGLGQIFAQEIVRQTSTAQVVLTGRSVSDKTLPERTVYRQVDLEDLAAVQALIDDLTATFGRLDGILHSAGQVADEFILNKNSAIFAQVLGPKVAGTVNLDLATRGIALDFTVLFSSIASAMGNVGQADYASGNGFMDQFAAYRNTLAAKGERLGRTVAINWPLWQEGGMKMEADSQAWMQQRFGVSPLQSAAGVQALYGALALDAAQALVLQGDRKRLEHLLSDAAPQPAVETAPAPGPHDGRQFESDMEDYLRRQLAGVLQMPSSRIDVQAPLENYGIDSVLAMTITRELEKTFGTLSKTLLFEYQTLAALARHFTQQHTDKVSALFAKSLVPDAWQATASQESAPISVKPSRKRAGRRREKAAAERRDDEPIAIIGMSGRYPLAKDLDAFWQNLREGRDCVTEVPADRWDWREYYSADRTKDGRHYSKWGGFIDGVDKFDSLFFNISPREARNIDPQERLFLQQTWAAIEDAGYTRAGLQGATGDGQVGVYAGVMYSEYQLFGAQAAMNGQHLPVGSSLASVANRVSYALNLHGPSMTLDTMCSSSLTAIHIACQDLKLGRTDMALAGGVNVTVHPQKYTMLSSGQFISSDGHCQSFGEGGDGYIPGEGVGVVVLKRLSDAQRDGDHICGVILGSSLNHGGKTNGYTVPNPQAQSGAISRALAEAKVDARHISYVEAHGTGTKLGDPIEIAALGKAFGQYTQERGFCLIGSAKSNIGHCESAAGIAGLMKVLLQMRHGEIVPSLHSTKLNPHIDFEQTPFVVNQTLTAWERPVIDGREVGRIAGLSSFGAGGSNAHMIVQEYREQRQSGKGAGPAAIVLSARTPQQLRQKAADLLAYLEQGDCADLQSIAYTLQTGREAMDERLGILASDLSQLADRLHAFVGGDEEGEGLFRGQAKRSQDGMNLISQDEDMKEAVGKWIARRKYGKLLELWSKGLDIDWSQLHGQVRPQRVSLPAYPFAEERCWVELPPKQASHQAAQLHPLLHTNTSDLSKQSYSSWFDGTEFFLADHQVKLGDASRKVLPAVAYLEMARAAISQALPKQSGQVLELQENVWSQPVIVDGESLVNIALHAEEDGRVLYEIYSVGDDGEETVHCDGSASYVVEGKPQPLALAALEAEMAGGVLDAETLYSKLWSMGLEYGPAHRAVQGVLRGDSQVLVRMQLPDDVQKSSQEYILHPSLMDGALQACASLLADGTAGTVLPYAVESVRVWQPCAQSMIAWVREASGSSAALRKLDLDLCDEQGSVCVQMRGFTARAVDGAMLAPSQDLIFAAPQWQILAAPERAAFNGKRHVWLCGLEQVSPAALAELMTDSRCVSMNTDGALARRYTSQAVALFEQVQALLRGGLHGQELLQLVVADNGEHALSAGLSGLLRTAALENPQLRAQLVLVDGTIGVQELAALLQAEPGSPSLVRYRDGRRSVQAWEQQRWQGGEWPVAFRDDGVYLITGGLGGLGQIFAQEIVRQTSTAQVVLTGRSASDKVLPGRTVYRQVDLEDPAAVQALIDDLTATFGRLDGILHSAGQVADEFILNKTSATFAQVLGPKVAGTVNLDLATRGIALDFMVLFSSIASAMGNVGQADYASGNGFMDQFAAYRNALAAKGESLGRTVAVNWPLWQEGGMKMEADSQAWMEQRFGVSPLQSAAGVQALYGALALDSAQALVLQGDRKRLERLLSDAAPQPAVETAPAPGPHEGRQFESDMEDYLRRQLAGVLQMPSSRIDVQAPLENYGIDSVLAMTITRELEKTFGTLSKTLLFEYQTLAALARYLGKAFPEVARGLAGGVNSASAVTSSAPVAVQVKQAIRRARVQGRAAPLVQVAIVGVSGQYPQAADLNAFWNNLKDGKDCIIEIPAERWDHAAYYDADKSKAGKIYGRWGGFMSDIDCFDPLFFGISPKEAERIDPQERMFLQNAWKAVEDAGYSRQSLAGRRIGVYVGVMWAQYELLSVEARLNGSTEVAGSSHASIANRVSYLFDWHGPSMALDTMCSSSLTAIHLACEAIRSGEIETAIAGGVNVSIHPQKYLGLSQGSFLSTDGRCRSFGEGGDGYVPGEGVGAFMLKRLEAAERDGDHVYAVIRANGVNHGGKTNGYSVPNPQAQGELIREVLKRGAVAPESINYVEAHGTGTALGDPIEIKGLLTAFGEAAEGRAPCPIGSVKSNIGHLEAAAGAAAVSKVLLQLKHRQLAPSLHALPANPHIDFAATPFRVQTELGPWTPPAAQKRRACISSFGAGGSNAHLVLDEYQPPSRNDQVVTQDKQLFLLSARDIGSLRNYASSMLEFLETDAAPTFADIAYTSQVGRVGLGVRLAVVASDRRELQHRLQQWISAQEAGTSANLDEDIFHGDAKALRGQLGDLISGGAGETLSRELLGRRDLSRLAQLWTLGMDIDWSNLPRHAAPQRVAMPTYPFARQRYWINTGVAGPGKQQGADSRQALYFRPQWTVQALNPPAAGDGGILVLGAEQALAAALCTKAGSGPAIVVQWGDAFAQDDGHTFTLNPAREEDFVKLVETLRTEQRLPSRVVHVCPAEVTRGAQVLLLLFKAYTAQRLQDKLRLLSVHAAAPGAPNPYGAAVAGMLRALALEEPRLLANTLQLDEVTAARADLIANELATGNMSPVRYQADEKGLRRSISALVPWQPAPGTAGLPLRQCGVYLITGGLGGLGLVFARYLARTCHATLILTGRGAIGASQQAKIDELCALGAQVRYVQGDVVELKNVESAVRIARQEFGALHGVIHSAGVTNDALAANKTAGQMAQVMAPKLIGTRNLDLATRDEALDWFVMFSSVAAQLGNIGQCDYAYANHFMDSYSELREGMRLAGQRSGQTLSINWPLWSEGGMQVADADLARMEHATGITPLPTELGLRCWETLLAGGLDQGMVLHGDPHKIHAALRGTAAPAPAVRKLSVQAPSDLAARTRRYLQEVIGEESKLPAECIDVQERFEAYGFDSVMVARVTARLEGDLGALPKTLMFEHETIDELAQYLLSAVQPALVALLAAAPEAAMAETPVAPAQTPAAPPVAAALPAPEPAPAPAAAAAEPIAIIGVHGMFPGSADLDAFWQQLKQGQDMIDIVPASRWIHRDLEGSIYCKWGGFLDDFDKFDPAFFNMSAEEARSVDPQERLFLQSVWSALEDAGYTREALRERHPKGKGSSVGVYVGVTTNTYHLCAPGAGDQATPAVLPWSIANRVSYIFDFEGPSMPVDTACSSSLVAMHLACESLRHGECQVAVAGGVNLYLHPSKYQSLCSRHMVSTDGRCRSYGADGDGFVPGEGVASLILKPLGKAIADGDQVYAVIRASAYAHSGRSNGYSAPNPNAQAGLIDQVLTQSGIHPETISYVEGHGTGTPLGDGIEIAALTKAFRRQSSRNGFCAVGSVKANIGHGESVAGIAGVSKVLLQMKHRQLAPTIHSEVANPNIDFDSSPFFLQRELTEWRATEGPRRALVNSFGAGGVNACVVLEECQRPAASHVVRGSGLVLPLSARNEDGLKRNAQQLADWLRRSQEADIADVCYTLQLGREAMEERLAFIADSGDEIRERLEAWLNTGDMTGVLRGRVDKRRTGARHASPSAGQEVPAAPAALAQAWVLGGAVDWKALHGPSMPARISVPAYAFEKQRYWFDDADSVSAATVVTERIAAPAATLHPLVSHNASTLRQTCFVSQLSPTGFHAVDHQVNQQRIFPGAGYLEIAAVCGALAAERQVFRLHDIVWAHPLSFEEGVPMLRTVLRQSGGSIEFSISSLGAEQESVIHSEGKIEVRAHAGGHAGEGSDVAISAIVQECASRYTGEYFYGQMRQHGLDYGPSFQVIREVHVGPSFALARMALPEQLRAGFGDYTLHPALMDGALQSVAVLLAGAGGPCLPFALDELEIVRPLGHACYALAEFAEPSGRGQHEVQKMNIRLFNESGELLVKFGNLYVRRLAAAACGTDRLLKDAA